ncbi:hypothetical protein FDECE_12147 [Fusarium decemcellulare]|nr:hypothetical protein FDECE_12147 [Fusarium decemcellulare]
MILGQTSSQNIAQSFIPSWQHRDPETTAPYRRRVYGVETWCRSHSLQTTLWGLLSCGLPLRRRRSIRCERVTLFDLHQGASFGAGGRRALFIKASKTYEKFFHDSSATSSFQIMGFITLTQKATRARPDAPLAPGLVEALDQQLGSLETDCLKLAERVSKRVEEEGLLQGDEVSPERPEKLLASNLIVEMILLPVSTFREVQTWARSTDVIGY